MKAWWNQLQSMWRGWSLVQRISIVGAAVVCVAAVVGVGAWSLQSQYVPVASDLSPTTAAELVSALDSAGIPNKLNYSGSSVLVPKQRLSEARLASGNIIDSTSGPSDDIDGSVWSDPTLHHVRLLRQQEKRLAHSISQFDFVKAATVHLSVPEPSPFVRDRVAPTASVVLELRGNVGMARHDAAAIVALVAHSVEGLDPSQVTVMDTRGHILSAKEAVEGDVAAQLEYRRRLESDLAAKAEILLSQMLGPGKAVVRVTADVDFTETQREKKTFDPEGKVKLIETTKSESHSGGPKPSTGGAAGQGTNGGGAVPGSSSQAATTKTEESTVEYGNAETRDMIRELPGKLLRLTVAAVVELPAAAADGSAPVITEEGVKSLIQRAVGFDEARSDQISVVTAPLAGAVPLLPEVPGVPWEQYEKVARAASLGLAAVVAMVVGLLVLRRFRPTVTVAAESAGPDLATERLSALTQRARENPEAVAQALSAWLASNRSGEAQPTVPFRKAG